MRDNETSARELAKNITSELNSFGFNYEAFFSQMNCEHRTLQQSFTRLCMRWFEHLASVEHFDGRNEASVMLARKIMEENKDWCLPMV